GAQFRELKPQALLRAFGLDLSDWYYQVTWEQSSSAATETAPNQTAAGNWLLFVPAPTSAAGPLGTQLADTLRAQGHSAIQVYPGPTFRQVAAQIYEVNPAEPEQFQQFLTQLAPTQLTGVVYLWGLGTNSTEPLVAQALICGGALHLVQGLFETFKTAAPRLWLVTQGAQSLKPDQPMQPQQASLWGLGRVITLEYPDLNCVCLDLDPAVESQSAAQNLIQELLQPDQDDQVAYRDQVRQVARLTQLRATQEQPVLIKSTGCYCITGGLGSLGLQFAQWLVSQGARQIVLVGRRQPTPPAQTVLAQLEAAGASVTVMQADVANRAEAERLFVQLEDPALQPLRGVIHAAGVLDDGLLQQQTWTRFTDVLRPKVAGAWHLHQLTQTLPLDFFVCFSSATALLGNPGQGNYAAANAFLDALMQHRQQQGLPGLSLNWGPWADVGMAAQSSSQAQSRLQAQGVKAIAPKLGLQTFAQALTWPQPQVGILAVDWPLFLQQFAARRLPSLLQALAADLALTTGHQAGPRLSDWIAELQQLDEQQRQQQVIDYLTEVVTHVLGREPGDRPEAREGFFNLGMDSLMAVDLVELIQKDLGIALSTTAAFEYANIEELAAYLDQALPRRELDSSQQPELDPFTAISQMSEPELEASLLAELEQLEKSLSL
ncbi:MAG: beta-ketoacyl reductase, partial [Cyanobacteria bacterium P01_H01_bin.121]